MVYHRNIHSKKRTRRTNKRKQPMITTITSAINQQSIENIDDETKLAKRHLTKEMWQLISIAVKRMADELVAISNNQQTVRASNQDLSVTLGDLKTDTERSLSTTTVQQLRISNAGAGDEPCVKEKINSTDTSNKQRMTTVPLHMTEISTNKKKNETSNNAKRQTNKLKRNKKISKKNPKITNQNLRNNRK